MSLLSEHVQAANVLADRREREAARIDATDGIELHGIVWRTTGGEIDENACTWGEHWSECMELAVDCERNEADDGPGLRSWADAQEIALSISLSERPVPGEPASPRLVEVILALDGDDIRTRIAEAGR